MRADYVGPCKGRPRERAAGEARLAAAYCGDGGFDVKGKEIKCEKPLVCGFSGSIH